MSGITRRALVMLLAKAKPRSSNKPRIWLTVVDHSLSGAMQGLDILPLDAFLGDEGDMRLARGRADGFHIVAVVLLPLQRERIKRKTIILRRLQHEQQAA